jgi:hypothetical protein
MTVLRALVATLAAALVASAGLLVVTAAPASACSCVSADTAQFVRWSDVVVRGTLVEIEEPGQSGTWSSTDPTTFTFEVAEVFRGRVGTTLEVESPVSGASCGLEGMATGQEYLLFAGYQDLFGEATETLHASLCGGTGGAGTQRVAEVEAVTGPGRLPEDDAGSAPGAAPGSPAAPAPSPEAASGVWVWGSGAGLLLAVVAATLVVGRRRTA